jgi:hypothetical protein
MMVRYYFSHPDTNTRVPGPDYLPNPGAGPSSGVNVKEPDVGASDILA